MNRIFKGFILLCRLDKPIGIYLILWPALAAAILTTDITSNPKILFVIVIGSILVRSIGCVINDIFDQDIDAKVERTKSRPLASGELSKFEGWIIFSLLMACILGLMLVTNLQTIIISSIFGCLIIIYPLMKRFFLGPQLFLGITFNPIFIVHALTESLNLSSVILYLGIFAWVVAFDTYYGLSDIEDDKKIGIHSTPLWWKAKTQNLIFLFQTIFLISLYMIGEIYEFSNIWSAGLILMLLLFVYQFKLARKDNPSAAFKNNNFVGIVMCVFLFLEMNYIA
ncbi:MAG: 4-hydroxybenzoate octaprenyltransferase [Gammaproteobacteria bacterium]